MANQQASSDTQQTLTNENLTDDLAQQIQQQMDLKNALTDFVLEAKDEGAIALETFSAQHSSRWAKPPLSGLNRSELAIDMFITRGSVAGQPVTDWFASTENPDRTERAWLTRWQNSFNGLFAVQAASADGYVLMNWLTEKVYRVRPNQNLADEVSARLAVDEIVLARLLPVAEGEWTFSGPMTLLGKLGKPKLAVAIGNFRQWFPQQLYGDAPVLQEAAWASVQEQYDDFLSFFGAEKVTLSGYELNKKLQAYQEAATEKNLAKVGIDSNQSLKAIAQSSGVSADELDEAIDAVGEESKAAKALLESDQSLKRVVPKIKLPDELRRAEAVTVLVHPRWGETFLTDYSRLETLLAKDESSTDAEREERDLTDRLVLKYLQDNKVTLPVWQRLAQDRKQGLEAALRRVMNQPEFNVEQDLARSLAKYGKSLLPQMPESASVPEHLDQLFKSALQSVGKRANGQSSNKKKAKKQKSGFGG